ncbi:organic cation transporter protein-like [Saccoglossus kowalevskii]
MQFEEILVILGEFGRYQKIQFFLLFIGTIPLCWVGLAPTFLSASSDHYCRVLPNQTYQDDSPLKNCTIPYTVVDDKVTWNQCNRYNVNITSSSIQCLPHPNTAPCDDGWVYDKSTYENTVVYEFDLVCEKDWMKQLSKSMVGAGQLFGALIFGQLADIYGRKPLFLIGLMLIIIFGIAVAFSPLFFLFVIGQFLLTAFANGVYLTGYVLGVELVGPSARLFCSMMMMLSFSLGYIAFAGVAYGCHGNWRNIQFIIGVVFVLFIPYIWIIPESVRWLIQKKQYYRAEIILHKAAKCNKVNLQQNIFDEEQKLEEDDSIVFRRHHTMCDLFKTPNLRCRTLNLCFNWMAVSLVYWGISLNTDELGLNPYLSFLISGAVEIPGYLLCWMLLDTIGRRWVLCSSMILGGGSLIASGCVPVDIPYLSPSLAMAGKMFVTSAFGDIYIFSAEIFPTCVRNAGIGISSTMARIGTIASPFIMLLITHWRPLPFIIMGIISIVGGMFSLLLPETSKQKLPETLEEGELFGTVFYVPGSKFTKVEDEDEESKDELTTPLLNNSTVNNTVTSYGT